MDNNKVNVDVDETEFSVAEAQAEEESSGKKYIHTFAKPFTYEGKTYTQLEFDWESLTGNDALAIENEMASIGKALIVPEFSGEYLMRMAARSCTTKIGSDVIRAMPLNDFNTIRSRARSFLMRSAL